MARVGINPARGKISDYRPARLTIASIVYIPDLSGYFEQRLEVLQLSLASLFAHTLPPNDLMIFDNGSCQEVVDLLRKLEQSGQITYLVRSHQNIGKIGALQLLFNAAPGQVIAYHDDDIFFYPGWLEAHLQILQAFPQVGMVSGLPVRNAARHARQSLERIAQEPPPGISISHERFIPDQWETDWAISTGRDPQQHFQATQNDLDMLLRLDSPQGSLQAVASANHFQFVGYKETLLQALPQQWSGKLMGHMVELDDAIDSLGRLRLSTTQRFTRHMGNILSQEILAEAQQLGLAVHSNLLSGDSVQRGAPARAHKKPWPLRIPGARRLLMAAYKRLFDILFRAI
jgi:hypothetical protein